MVDAYGGCGRSADVEILLERVLPELPVVGDRPAARTRRADLWQRLGGGSPTPSSCWMWIP